MSIRHTPPLLASAPQNGTTCIHRSARAFLAAHDRPHLEKPFALEDVERLVLARAAR
ncbi:MAG: hypothetical protein AB7S26_07030 [Sandaracinaceae bacterium]